MDTWREWKDRTQALGPRLERYLAALYEQKGGPGSGFFGHAGRPGQRGGSAPGQAVGAGRGKFAAGVSGADRRAITSALGACDLPAEDMARVSQFATSGAGSFKAGPHDFGESGGARVLAFQNPVTGDVHIHPSAISPAVVAHEVGHAQMGTYLGKPKTMNALGQAGGKIRDYLGVKRGAVIPGDSQTVAKLAKIGLDHYAMTNVSEFFASLYAFHHLTKGRPGLAARKELERVLDIKDLGELFA